MTLLLPLVVGAALGLVLGLLGGGGGILAVPLLLVLGMSMDQASTASLVVVGIGAAAGLLMHARPGRVEWRIGLLFGLLGTVGAVAGARLSFVADDRLQLGGLVVLLLFAGWGMIRQRRPDTESDQDAAPAPNWWRAVLFASGVGLITGFFGVGGGFVTVPALVLALRMPMKRASATALVVILVNVTAAFLARGTAHLDLTVTAWISGAAAVGAVAGALLQTRVGTTPLQRGFGVLLLAVAGYETAVILAG